ncbi:MAG TPA: hypothetical protein VIX11_06825 [Candidatus Acidoferrum sp.]
MTEQVKFTEEIIQSIFGHEAAEDEDIERLKAYYFKSPVYEKVRANVALRILVGHKGIGKSALFTVAMHEDGGLGRLPILIRPDDVTGIGKDSADFLQTIREWKERLRHIVARKAFESIGVGQPGRVSDKVAKIGKFVNFLRDTLEPLSKNKLDLEPSQQKLMQGFLISASHSRQISENVPSPGSFA